jgi:prolyl-tRNA synthetase
MVPAGDGEDLVLICPKCKLTKSFKEETSDICSKCSVRLERINTLEVGHIFKLGTKYSSTLGANFIDDAGKQKPIIMGCYGIGVSRLISAIVERNHDNDGIIWPFEISPYKIIILPLDVSDEKIMSLALDIYKELDGEGISLLLDDRDERAGVKFKDADLIGIPINIIVGQKAQKEKKVEIKTRRDNRVSLVDIETCIKTIKKIIGDEVDSEYKK